jgi:cbb3-type cytochrome oxidase maturation protein
MEVLFVLIPVSIALATASVVACLFAIRGGQYDDLESPPWRMLFDPSARFDKLSAASSGRRGSGNDGSRIDAKEKCRTSCEEETPGAHSLRSKPL